MELGPKVVVLMGSYVWGVGWRRGSYVNGEYEYGTMLRLYMRLHISQIWPTSVQYIDVHAVRRIKSVHDLRFKNLTNLVAACHLPTRNSKT